MAEHSPNDATEPLSDLPPAEHAPEALPPNPAVKDASTRTLFTDSPDNGLAPTRPVWEPRLSPEVNIPGYEILGELGRGGMGVVYKARQLSLKRLVALKMVLPEGLADPEAQARFRAEAEAVAALQHPNIVQIYEIGEYHGRPYFALELVGGGNLADRAARGPFDPEEAARLVKVLAEAVHYAHQHDVIHRDLKPSNVLLTEDGTPKISDFGLAKQLRTEAARTRTGVILGSPGYMAPEQAQGKGKDVGPATDIYGLGAILYDLLTGQAPHATDDWVVALRQMVLGEVTPPSRLRPSVPPALEAICLKCLEKEPHRRYPTAHALACALGRFLSGESIDEEEALPRLVSLPPSARRGESEGGGPPHTPPRMLPGELQQLLRNAEPGAVLVPPLAFERVLRETGKPLAASTLPGLHGGPVVDRHVLFKYVEQEELFLGPDQLLPPTVVLIPAPPAERLEPRARKKLLSDYWRVLFNARIRLLLRERSSAGLLSAADVSRRMEPFGPTVFAEIRSVLGEEGCLPAPADDVTVFIEFAALYLELRYFAAELLPCYFPGLPSVEVIDALLAEDIDANGLFERTRLPGAVYPTPRTSAVLEESHDYFLKLRQAAEREVRANHTVSAAILHTRAARVAPADKASETRREAERDLQRLGVRLRDALQLTAAETGEWLHYLTPLLDKSDQGSRPVEATLLYDLERVCTDQENEIYALDAVEWLLSAGRRPLKRPLPGQRLLRLLQHLRIAHSRLPRTRLSGADRQHLDALFLSALARTEQRLRERFRPLLDGALTDVGLVPTNVPERNSFRKLVEELLDRILGHGFLTFADLRDTLARNQIKLPDMTDPQQLLRNDPLLRLDRRLTTLLDGVYRPSEFYLRWLHRLTALNFGTRTGRAITRWLTLPFGGALLLVEGVEVILKYAGVEAPAQLVSLIAILATGLFLLGLIHSRMLRRASARVAWGVGQLLQAVFFALPARMLRIAALRRMMNSWPFQLFYWYLLKPLVVCLLLWWLFPEAFKTMLGSTCIFLATAFILNSRPVQAVNETLSRDLLVALRSLRSDLLPGLFRLVMRLFKQLLDGFERLLYTVDEGLRVRRGAGPVMIAILTVLGVLWFPISFLGRFYVVVLVEPMMNPLKLPITIVAAKFLYPATYFNKPLMDSLAALLAPYLGFALGYAFVLVTLFLLPDAFGFLIWEMKENWRLYKANRSLSVQPVPVGPSGETLRQLFQPGLHSGTVPRLFARLRHASLSGVTMASWETINACRHSLQEIERDLRLFVAREALALLEQAEGWHASSLGVGRVDLATNRVRLELTHAQHPRHPAWLQIELCAGWLVAGFTQPGWLARTPAANRGVLGDVLLYFYKVAGIDLVREQLRANLPASAVGYRLTADRLVVWSADHPEQRIFYDLKAPGDQLEPLTATGEQAKDWPVLDARRLVLARIPLTWARWVESWRKSPEGHTEFGMLSHDVDLVPPEAASGAA